MKDNWLKQGYIDVDDWRKDMNYPSEARRKQKAVAAIECFQEIPCNPCRDACPAGAIVLHGLVERPKLMEDLCTGCGLCVAVCPGQAIFLVEERERHARITFPYEYVPLPTQDMMVEAVNRAGETVCQGRVLRVAESKTMNKTRLVTLEVPLRWADEVRSMKRLEGDHENG